MKLRIFQKGFNFSQDGPGNRLVYHLQGCNLHCPWCSNPEGLSFDGGTEYEVAEIVEEVKRSSLMFFDGGGVTLTGGEVAMQLDAVKELFTALKAENINTCIETNGTNPRLPELYPLIDHLIMDIKHYDSAKHKAVTGLPNDMTVRCIRAAIEQGRELSLRIPLIGGFNADAEDAQGFATLLTGLGVPGHATLEVLTYHEYGKDKYARLGLPYTMDERARIKPEQLKEFRDILSAAGVELVKT